MRGEMVIFLDVDGVLNSIGTTDKAPNGYMGLDADKCQLFRDAVLRTDASIVLSSTWRLHPIMANYLWKKLGEDVAERYIGKTRDGAGQILGSSLYRSASRGDEIKDWLDRRPECTNFLILDDANIENPGLKPFHIQTRFSVGLTKELADKISFPKITPNQTAEKG